MAALILAASAVALFLCAEDAGVAAEKRSPPNFVFMLADDLGWTDLGCYGTTFYESPSIDRLAAEGMKFTQAYAAGSVCSPTRGSIMTGKSPVRTGVTDYIPGLRPTGRRLLTQPTRTELALEELTVAEALKQQGYQTFYSGKWHLGGKGFGPEDQGFEVVVSDSSLGNSGKDPLVGDRLTDSALRFLDDRDKSRPFFMFLGYHEPHTPILDHPAHIGRFREKAAKLKPAPNSPIRERDGLSRTVQDWPGYATEVMVLDDGVRRVREKLAALGLTDSTTLIFFSDNGGLCTKAQPGPTANLPLRSGKGWLYEGGIRVPLVIYSPGLTKAGSVCDVPVISMDFFPTLLQMAGAPLLPQRHVDGVSIVPLLRGGTLPPRALYWHYPHYHGSTWAPGSAIREGDAKLIEFLDEGSVELYDLRDDLGEHHNLATKLPERTAPLRAKLSAWRVKTGAVMPKPNPDCASAKIDPLANVYGKSGVRGGLVVELGIVDPEFTARLGQPDAVVVQTLATDPHQVAAVRKCLAAKGLYGKVTVELFDGRTLPYADNLVNLVVLHDPGATGDRIAVPDEEILRALAPGGALCSWAGQPAGGEPRIVRKPWPEDVDDWTHFLHGADGNAVAADRRVAPAASLQWVAEPLFCRSHEIDSSVPAMVSAKGRLFYILDEGPIGITDPRFPARWSLLARDAFNGVLLWKRPLEPWGWQQWKPELRDADWRTLRGERARFPAEVPRRLVAVGDRVYMTIGFQDAPLSILDAATGNVLEQCPGSEGTEEIVVDGDTIFARICSSHADAAKRRGKTVSARLAAIDAAGGETRWSQEVGGINPLTLAAAGGAVVFRSGPRLLCYDQRHGKPRWQADSPAGGMVVIHKDVVLTTGKSGTHAFSLAEGKPLWQGPGTGRDLFVIQDLVWRVEETIGILQNREERWPTLSRSAGAHLSGYDFRTGELRRTIDVPNAMSPGHHLRCYRSKATDRFILFPKRGAEFLDLEGNDHMRQDWLRGSCRYGVLPCNGLLYTPPDQCFCYIGAKMNGLVATCGAGATATAVDPRSPDRLMPGPACEQASAGGAGPADWPGYRADARRSGCNRQADVSRDVQEKWRVKLAGKLTQPTVAAGMVFVAAVDRQTVYAFDAASGRPLWHYVAGGRVDSSPTYHAGQLLFGANDGNVYCLDAASGQLAWSFRAAPNSRRIVAFGEVESPWPVHGTVLVMNSLAYVVAGRSTLIDGGAHFYALEPRTGRVVHYARVEQPRPDLAKDIGEHFAMDGSNIDVLTTDGKHIFCMQEMFDAKLNPIKTAWNTRQGDRFMGEDHLIATGGLLDDSGFNRLWWTYGNRWPGFYFMMMAPKSGNLLVFDSDKTWATKWFVERNIHSPLSYPATTGYLLFCDKNTTRPFLAGDPGAPKPISWLPDTRMKPYDYDGRTITNRYDDYSVEVDKGAGFTRSTPAVWQEYLPVRIEAMTLTKDVLFAAGSPDVCDPGDPLGALEGRKGGLLLAIDPASGKRISQQELSSPPSFDGMSAAGRCLFLVTRHGELTAME